MELVGGCAGPLAKPPCGPDWLDDVTPHTVVTTDSCCWAVAPAGDQSLKKDIPTFIHPLIGAHGVRKAASVVRREKVQNKMLAQVERK